MEAITLRQAFHHEPSHVFAILVDIRKRTDKDLFEIEDSSIKNIIMEVKTERPAIRKLTETGLKVKIVNPELDTRCVFILSII